jgi:regulator of protease activity HflC (stomatin/prohibitin superfamily)
MAMPFWVGLLLALTFAAALVLVFRESFERVTVLEFERALKYHRGRYSGLVDPGQYWIYRRRTTLLKLDVRPRFISVPGQEVLTSDAVTLRVSLAAEYEIVDPAVAINQIEDFEAALYLTLQLALREVIGTSEIDDLLEKRAHFGERLLELSADPAAALGLKLHRVDLKDIMFPGDLKKTFAQPVTARKEGLAALERARGETAALRNLANAARMLDGNPTLMQLRLLQQIGESAGNTIVLGLPSSATPLPLKEPDLEQPRQREFPADEE